MAKGRQELMKQYTAVLKQEQRWRAKMLARAAREPSAFSEKVVGAVPQKVRETCEQAFHKGFAAIFEKGDKILARAIGEDRAKERFAASRRELWDSIDRKKLRSLHKNAAHNSRMTQLLTAAEGTLLGVLGIGLPDIPIFLGMLLKTVYEPCLSYGFDYRDTRERVYILCLIASSAGAGLPQSGRSPEEMLTLCEAVGRAIDQGAAPPLAVEEAMELAASALSQQVVTAKLIPGLPLVGAAGGAANLRLVRPLSQLACIGYRKRFLLRLFSEEKARR